MKNLLDWCKHHLVASWAIASAVFAVVIHIFFSIPAPFEWLEATWSAGDVLTYVSTIALGLLAVWQNQKFKEESDKAQVLMDKQNTEAQARLERLNQQANEISLITKIVDYESSYLQHLEGACHDFADKCSSDKLLVVMKQNQMNGLNIGKYITEITHSFTILATQYDLGLELNDLDMCPMIDSCNNLFSLSTNLLFSYKTKGIIDDEISNKQFEAYKDALSAIDTYLVKRRNTISRILIENKSLAEVRATYVVFEEDTNEQTKT